MGKTFKVFVSWHRPRILDKLRLVEALAESTRGAYAADGFGAARELGEANAREGTPSATDIRGATGEWGRVGGQSALLLRRKHVYQ
jgi:hypothetical protein